MTTSEEINSFTNDFIDRCFEHPGGGDWDIPIEDMSRMSILLAAILDIIIERSGNQSKWESSCRYECNGRPSARVEATMRKTGARCGLILYAGTVTLGFSLPHSEELPSMDSAFWALLSSSIKTHGLTYFSGENLSVIKASAENKKLSKFVKAPIFNFISEFTMAFQANPECQYIGDFEKSVFFKDSDWYSIIDLFAPVVAEFSKLSQALYRSYYIKASRNPTKAIGLANLDMVNAIFSWIMARKEPWGPEDVKTAFPDAAAIDIRTAHQIAAKRDVISGIDSRPKFFCRKANPTG